MSNSKYFDFDEPSMDEPIYEEAISDDQRITLENKVERVGIYRIGSPVIKKLLASQLIAVRANQIHLGDRPRVDTGGIIEPSTIAQMELAQRVIPLKVIRIFPDDFYEIWHINEFKMIISPFFSRKIK